MRKSRVRFGIIGAVIVILFITLDKEFLGSFYLFDILFLLLTYQMFREATHLSAVLGFVPRNALALITFVLMFLTFTIYDPPMILLLILFVSSILVVTVSILKVFDTRNIPFNLGFLLPIFWASVPMFYLLLIRRLTGGTVLLLYLFLLTWTNDSSAYFIGRRFGRHLLAPKISPKKTIEGAAAGLIGAVILGSIFFLTYKNDSSCPAILKNFPLLIIVSLMLSILGQCGDLIESRIKRLSGVKDSSSVFLGHGGALDRFDALLIMSPVAYFIFKVSS